MHSWNGFISSNSTNCDVLNAFFQTFHILNHMMKVYLTFSSFGIMEMNLLYQWENTLWNALFIKKNWFIMIWFVCDSNDHITLKLEQPSKQLKYFLRFYTLARTLKFKNIHSLGYVNDVVQCCFLWAALNLFREKMSMCKSKL